MYTWHTIRFVARTHFWFVVVVIFFQYRFIVKIHVQVHFTIASQFYIREDVELFLHVFMHLYGGGKQVC